MTTTTIREHLSSLGITKPLRICRVRGRIVHEEGPYGARVTVPEEAILPVGATITIPDQGSAVITSSAPGGYRRVGERTDALSTLVDDLLNLDGATISI